MSMNVQSNFTNIFYLPHRNPFPIILTCSDCANKLVDGWLYKNALATNTHEDRIWPPGNTLWGMHSPSLTDHARED